MTSFHEDARQCILSILSVLEAGKVQKGLCKAWKKLKNPKKLPRGAKIPIRYFQSKKSEDKKVVEESDNLKNVAVLHDSSEERCGDDSACSDSGGSESDCKDWKWSCSKPLWDYTSFIVDSLYIF